MLDLFATQFEDPAQARAIAKIEPRPMAAFLYGAALVMGALLSLLVVYIDRLSFSAVLSFALAGVMTYVLAWIPWTFFLHGLCRVLGFRASLTSLQTQLTLALVPLIVLPPVGLVQCLFPQGTKMIFWLVSLAAVSLMFIFWRQGIIANYGMTRTQATIALVISFVMVGVFLSIFLAGVISSFFLGSVASALL